MQTARVKLPSFSQPATVAAFPSSFTSFSSDISYSEGADQVPSRLESAPSSFSITEQWMPEGVDGTYLCCDAMCDAVMGRIPPDYSGYQDQWVIALASKIARTARNSSSRACLNAVLDWVKQNIHYVPHPITVQVVKDARRCVESGEGDCVSMSVLIATLLASLGYDVRFCVQYWGDDELYTHVFCEARPKMESDFIALDAVAKDKPMGTIQSLPDDGFNYTHDIF